VPRIVEIIHMRHVKDDFERLIVKNDLRLTSSTYGNNIDVDILDKHK